MKDRRQTDERQTSMVHRPFCLDLGTKGEYSLKAGEGYRGHKVILVLEEARLS